MKKKTYRHIFFDLDKTLWDFDTNSIETFKEIFNKYNLTERGVHSFDEFLEVYNKHNHVLWEFYRQGEIVKEVLNIRRFALTLHDFGINDNLLSSRIAEDYVSLSPTKTNLFPHTIAILEYLSKKYTLHIITNGFEEVQYRKLTHAGLMMYFSEIITSEDAGSKKPERLIFNYALKRSGALPEESLMIGDDEEVDIVGAFEAGMDQVLVDYKGELLQTKATYRIESLDELYGII
ncbi:MAG: YjjG family noncanonical pyrimidine nucleotidase [Bacteroidota bacterium]